MDTLEQLFRSKARVRLMRLFLLNQHTPFERKELPQRVKTDARTIRRELHVLENAGVIKKRNFYKKQPDPPLKQKKTKRSSKRSVAQKKRVAGYQFNEMFSYAAPLYHLLITSTSFRRDDIAKRIKSAGTIKLIVLSGIFIREDSGAIDILVVGDNLKKTALEKVFAALEADVGKELSYAFLETKDFIYRLGMYDKFVRDVLDYPHEKIVDKIGVE